MQIYKFYLAYCIKIKLQKHFYNNVLETKMLCKKWFSNYSVLLNALCHLRLLSGNSG